MGVVDREKANRRMRAFRDRRRTILREAKARPCADCGRSYPHYVMDFDHVRGDKSINVADVIYKNWSEKRLTEEIAKCDVVCANCHRIRTHQLIAHELGLRVLGSVDPDEETQP